MQKIKPNLFIVGAAKSGTTSLHYYLSQHPDIYMSYVKEPHYFSNVKSKIKEEYQQIKKGKQYHNLIIKDEDTYLSIFEEGADKIYRGEASGSYLFDPDAAKKIFEFNPQAKIIIILREPVDRAYSHYKMMYGLGGENHREFLKAITEDQKDNDRVFGRAHLYLELGQYYEQIQRYSAYFAASQILILKFEDFIKDPQNQLKKVFSFLDLDESKVTDFKLEAKNISKSPRNHLMNKVIRVIKKNKVLNLIRNTSPDGVKNIFKSLIFIDKGKKSDDKTGLLLPEVKEYLDKTFYSADKEKLKEVYGIFWD
jgi:hypothetical protein